MKQTLHNIIGLLAIIALPLSAAELQTEWIKPVEGFKDSSLGATITAVEPVAADGGARVTLAVPKAKMGNSNGVEEIIVTAKKPGAEKNLPEISIRHEWVADYDNDNYGLVVYLGKDGSIPFRLYFSIPEEQR